MVPAQHYLDCHLSVGGRQGEIAQPDIVEEWVYEDDFAPCPSNDVADTLGWVYIKKNLSDDAVRVYKDLVVKDPANATFHYHFGMALLQKGDRPSARKELEIALADKPSKDDDAKIRNLLQQP